MERKYPQKYSRDGGAYQSIGGLARALARRIAKGGSGYRELLESEFMWGSWGIALENLESWNADAFSRDVGSLAKFIYLLGLGKLDEYDAITELYYEGEITKPEVDKRVAELFKPKTK